MIGNTDMGVKYVKNITYLINHLLPVVFSDVAIILREIPSNMFISCVYQHTESPN